MELNPFPMVPPLMDNSPGMGNRDRVRDRKKEIAPIIPIIPVVPVVPITSKPNPNPNPNPKPSNTNLRNPISTLPTTTTTTTSNTKSNMNTNMNTKPKLRIAIFTMDSFTAYEEDSKKGMYRDCVCVYVCSGCLCV